MNNDIIKVMSGAALSVLALAAVLPMAAVAQNYPVETVRVVIPWPPGGTNDIVGRIVVQKLGESLGQQFVVDNRGGAEGSIGADVVAKAAPDGYTIMVHSATHVGNAHLYGKKLTYDSLKDFTGISLLSAQPGALTAHPSLPVKSVPEFLKLARSRPGEILYSSSGNGSAPQRASGSTEFAEGRLEVADIFREYGPVSRGAWSTVAASAGDERHRKVPH